VSLSALLNTQLSANELSINYSQLEQPVSFQNNNLLLKPSGAGIAFAMELNQNWNLAFDYQAWQDQSQLGNSTNVAADLSTWGTSLSYFQDDWFVSSNLAWSEDDLSMQGNRRAENYRTESTSVNSFSLTTGYNWQQENWLYDVNVTVQYNQWDIYTEQQKNKPGNSENLLDNPLDNESAGQQANELITENIANNSTSINLGTSISHYWSLADNKGVLTGLMLSWSHTIAGDEVFENEQQRVRSSTRPTSRSNQQSNNALSSPISSGDDSYGQVSFYLSYDLTEKWSLDFDLSKTIASTENSQSWSVGSAYYF